MKFYIAYGSNLNKEQMAHRCPDAEPVGTAILDGWELVFNSVLTIEPNPDEKVPVGIWKISEEDERSLDVYEGFPRLYRKETMRVKVKHADGKIKAHSAIVYVMNAGRRDQCPPSRHYYDIVVEGYNDFGFDPVTVDDAVVKAQRYVFPAA